MLCYEESFTNNPLKEHNWDFYYYIIRDSQGDIELATVLTKCWCKDDIFKSAHVSAELESLRVKETYLLCSETLMMGTLMTEGQHLYQKDINNNKTIALLLDKLNELQSELNLNSIYLRDFNTNETKMTDYLTNNGFIKVQIPEPTNVLQCNKWFDINDFLNDLSRKKRKEVKYNAIKFENKFEIEVKQSLPQEELTHFYKLYQNVKDKSYIINTFELPFKFLRKVNQSSTWEFIVLKLKSIENNENEMPVAIILCNKSSNNYIPQLIGMDYQYLNSHKIYKQSILQIVKRAIELHVNTIYFGITASTEKKRFGAIPIEKNVFLQVKDTFNMDVLKLESY